MTPNEERLIVMMETIKEILPSIRVAVMEQDQAEVQMLWATFQGSMVSLANDGLANLVKDIEEGVQGDWNDALALKLIQFCMLMEPLTTLASTSDGRSSRPE